MSGVISPYGTGLVLVASTGLAGFTMQNASPTFLSWTAPNDGNMHRASLWLIKNVISAETGGKINYSWTAPGNTPSGYTADPGSNAGPGLILPFMQPWNVLMQPGTSISFVQVTALTAGASVVWAEIWGA